MSVLAYFLQRKVQRGLHTAVLDVTAALGTVGCNYQICFPQKNSDSEAVACKLFNEVNKASAFSNRFYDLPSHTAAVSDHKMEEVLGHTGREKHLTPSTSPACVLSEMKLQWRYTPSWPQSSEAAGSCSRAPAVSA